MPVCLPRRNSTPSSLSLQDPFDAADIIERVCVNTMGGMEGRDDVDLFDPSPLIPAFEETIKCLKALNTQVRVGSGDMLKDPPARPARKRAIGRCEADAVNCLGLAVLYQPAALGLTRRASGCVCCCAGGTGSTVLRKRS